MRRRVLLVVISIASALLIMASSDPIYEAIALSDA
jgi:hypothetical protein